MDPRQAIAEIQQDFMHGESRLKAFVAKNIVK
jgi:hypothetical protein